MYNINSKLLKIIIAFFIIITGTNSALACGSDEQCYNSNLHFIETKETIVCYTNYFYNGKFYKLNVPCTRQEFIKLDNQARSGQLDQNSYNYKLVQLNGILTLKGFEPLYY